MNKHLIRQPVADTFSHWRRLKEDVKFIGDAKTLNEEIKLFWLDE